MLIALILALTLASDSTRFPVVTSESLEGRTFTLPRDFDGARNVVFVAFERRQQRDVDSWVQFVKSLVSRTPETEYYEIPTIKRMVAPMRWMINRGMRGGIDDRGARVDDAGGTPGTARGSRRGHASTTCFARADGAS